MIDYIKRVRIEPRGKGIVHQKMGDCEQSRIARIGDSISLQRAQIIGVSEFTAQLLKEFPVALLSLVTYLLFQMTLQVFGHTVIVQQCVVYVEEEHYAFVR